MMAQLPAMEYAIRNGIYMLEKYVAGPDGLPEGEPYETLGPFKNAYVNVGGVALLNLVAGLGGTAFTNAAAFIGVAESGAATTTGMTDLQGSTKTYKAMDATFPSLSGQVMTWKSTFASGDANNVWAEIALFNGNNPPTAKMLSRIAQAMGTKASGSAWVPSYTVTVP
jgi:hypothetical protein